MIERNNVVRCAASAVVIALLLAGTSVAGPSSERAIDGSAAAVIRRLSDGSSPYLYCLRACIQSPAGRKASDVPEKPVCGGLRIMRRVVGGSVGASEQNALVDFRWFQIAIFAHDRQTHVRVLLALQGIPALGIP